MRRVYTPNNWFFPRNFLIVWFNNSCRFWIYTLSIKYLIHNSFVFKYYTHYTVTSRNVRVYFNWKKIKTYYKEPTRLKKYFKCLCVFIKYFRKQWRLLNVEILKSNNKKFYTYIDHRNNYLVEIHLLHNGKKETDKLWNLFACTFVCLHFSTLIVKQQSSNNPNQQEKTLVAVACRVGVTRECKTGHLFIYFYRSTQVGQ